MKTQEDLKFTILRSCYEVLVASLKTPVHSLTKYPVTDLF